MCKSDAAVHRVSQLLLGAQSVIAGLMQHLQAIHRSTFSQGQHQDCKITNATAATKKRSEHYVGKGLSAGDKDEQADTPGKQLQQHSIR